jgi:hypothetical protein
MAGTETGMLALLPERMPGHMMRKPTTKGGAMSKFHARPSLQYRYEHYDPRM